MERQSTVSETLRSFAESHGLPAPLIKDAVDGQHLFLYSRDNNRRYAYALTWAADKPHLLWVMLNPGTGETEGRRRNTFERCKRWSVAMGQGGLIFGNVFSLRTKSAKDLLKSPQPSDELNKQALVLLSGLATQTIVAWGNHGARSDQPASMREILNEPKCFGLTTAGQPRHPLYVPAAAQLVAW